MLKQRDIIERLNRLTIGYNLTWDDVKYDADRAIDKINGFLGSAFPPMSEFLTHPDATYSVRSGIYDYEIVKDIYILNIVLPYIAMEVLARDEEFTTVFNKYAAEVENNLFTMFQREYHNIPEVFMQKGDIGVLFPAQSSYAGNNAKNALQLFKFRVVYHLDNEQVVCITPVDTTAYEYGSEFTVLEGVDPSITDDGVFVHTFDGWYLGSVNGQEYVVGNKYKITSDVHLHARWRKSSTLSISNGYLSVSNDYKNQITNLIVPEYVNGQKVMAFAASFFADNKSIQRLVIPGSFSTLNVEGYEGFQLDITKSNVPLTIETNCFRNCPNITSIFIPYRVRAIKAGAFPAQLNAIKTINCEILEINKPSGWVDGWYTTGAYNVVWGYNG